VIYHSIMYGQQLDPYSESFEQTIMRLQHFAARVSAAPLQETMVKARILLSSFVHNQAFIRSVDDVFLLAAIILVIALIPVFFLRKRRKISGRHTEMVD
jgi:hypothetical protein